MIFNRKWHADTYDYGADPAQGPPFFLGGAAHDEQSTVVVIGGVKVPDGWLLFAQLPVLYEDRQPFPEGPPRTVSEFLDCEGPNDDPITGVIFETDGGGWEWDVVGEALAQAIGYATRLTEAGTKDEARAALISWVGTMDLGSGSNGTAQV